MPACPLWQSFAALLCKRPPAYVGRRPFTPRISGDNEWENLVVTAPAKRNFMEDCEDAVQLQPIRRVLHRSDKGWREIRSVQRGKCDRSGTLITHDLLTAVSGNRRFTEKPSRQKSNLVPSWNCRVAKMPLGVPKSGLGSPVASFWTPK